MRDPAERQRALDLVASGVKPAHAADQLGLSRGTVAHWVDPVRRATYERRRAESGACPPCEPDLRALDLEAYSHLLGLYLGDGHIVRPRGRSVTPLLTVFCCNSWPGLIEECRDSMQRVLDKVPYLVQRKGCTSVCAYDRHLPCIFPQSGPGRKHNREISLVDWQREIVTALPGPLLKGLFHSDGWRGTNRVRRAGKSYEYPRYMFKNKSSDILQICTDALDAVGVAWRPTNQFTISVAKREAVALLDTMVGPKY